MIRETVTFITWLWSGWRPGAYDYRHVNRLYRQLKQHMTGAWRLVCITDDETGIECDTFPLWTMPRARIPGRLGLSTDGVIPDCFIRLKLFNPAVAEHFGDLLVSIDLDTTVYSDLRPLLTNDDFKIAFNEGRSGAPKYCGTLWQLRTGAHPELWTDYDPATSPKAIAEAGLRGSDQSWFTLKVPNAPMWNREDGVYWVKRFKPRATVPPNARIVYFAGDVKPWGRECEMLWSNFYTPL